MPFAHQRGTSAINFFFAANLLSFFAELKMGGSSGASGSNKKACRIFTSINGGETLHS